MLFPVNAKADYCVAPESVGTKSVGRDAVTVGWEYVIAPTGDYSFDISYAKEGNDFSAPSSVNSDGSSTEYTYDFTGLDEETVYYWKLTVKCSSGTNNSILKSFKTTPTLDITGFLFVDGTITLNRRIKIDSDFSYFRTPIFDLLTTSVGSGRLHVIDIY